MNRNLRNIVLVASLVLAVSACTKDPVVQENEDRTPIELSVTGVDSSEPATRSVITDGSTTEKFAYPTKIFMVVRSDGDLTSHDGYEYNGTDKNTTKYTVTRGDVTANSNTVVFDDKNVRYWNDAHSRSSQLSIWAYAQPNATSTWNTVKFGSTSYDTGDSRGWVTTEIEPTILEWNVGNPAQNQSGATIVYQDLCFSNNLVNYDTDPSTDPSNDHRLKYDFTTRKFPLAGNAELKFYHAMSKITVEIMSGDGYKGDGTDFVLANSKSVDFLSGFNTKGKFDIKEGEFIQILANADITTIPCVKEVHSTAEPYYTLQALIIPSIANNGSSRFVSNDANVMLQFTIDGNTYKITSDMMYAALHGKTGVTENTDNGTYIPMEAGKNYVFRFNIEKTKIKNISASLAPWTNVTADEQTPSNAYVNVAVKTSEGVQLTGDASFDFYRAAAPLYTGEKTSAGYNAYADYTWATGYEKAASLTETTTSGIYNTGWYWPNNNTFYHFRSLSPKGEAVSSGTNDYVAISGGIIKQGEVTAKDYTWGAPFKTTSPTPDGYSFTTGYCNNATPADGQLYKAIGASNDNIMLIQHHMTSQVFVDLETVASPAEAQVDLTDATVQLVNIAGNAKLYMGNGLITEYSSFGNVSMTADQVAAVSSGSDQHPAYDYSYGVLPQILNNTNGAVGIIITARDGNQYIINDIRSIKAAGTNVTEWLPGRKYYYKFTLSKTKIDKVEATLVNWINVEADDNPVQIQ